MSSARETERCCFKKETEGEGEKGEGRERGTKKKKKKGGGGGGRGERGEEINYEWATNARLCNRVYANRVLEHRPPPPMMHSLL